MKNLLGRYPGRALQRIGTCLTGLWIAGVSINQLWPLPDQSITNNGNFHNLNNNLYPLKNPVSILVGSLSPVVRRSLHISLQCFIKKNPRFL